MLSYRDGYHNQTRYSSNLIRIHSAFARCSSFQRMPYSTQISSHGIDSILQAALLLLQLSDFLLFPLEVLDGQRCFGGFFWLGLWFRGWR